MTKRSVLIITYYWPPTGGSGVQRWVKFTKYLPEFGWQPVIYTPSNPEQLAVDESLLGEIPPTVEVLKTRISEPYGIYRRLFGKKGKGSGKGEVNPLNSQKKSLLKKLAVLVRGNCFIPDPRASWVGPSVKFLKKYISEHPVDAIVTTGPPHSMHLIGLKLMKELRKGGNPPRWFADFRDPWTEMFYFKHLGLLPFAERRHRRMEKSVLDSCDGVIAVTPLVQADFQSKTATPVHLVTNGYDECDFDRSIRPDDKFTIVHTGLFAADGNPLEIWGALADKCGQAPEFRRSLRIRLAGKTDPQIIDAIQEAGLGDNLLDMGYIDHKASVSELLHASVLLLPLRQEPEYAKVYPGKLFEYLAADRPVLGIGQTDSISASLLRDTGSGEMFGWTDRTGPAEFIDREWERHLKGEYGTMGKGSAAFSREALAEKISGIL